MNNERQVDPVVELRVLKLAGVIVLLMFLCGIAGFVVGRLSAESIHSEEITEIADTENLTDWQIFRMAVIKTESEFNPKAVGKTKDYGIFQITPIYAKEANRLLGHEEYKHEDAFDPIKSLEMFDIIQSHYNPECNIDTAIKNHNPGGNSIGYANKVYKNIDWIKRMEDIRKAIVRYDSTRIK